MSAKEADVQELEQQNSGDWRARVKLKDSVGVAVRPDKDDAIEAAKGVARRWAP